MELIVAPRRGPIANCAEADREIAAIATTSANKRLILVIAVGVKYYMYYGGKVNVLFFINEEISNYLVILLIMNAEERLKIEEKVIEMLRTVYDPEIPVDVYSLGLVYKIDLNDDYELNIDMTMTAPSCPMADFIVEDARIKLESIEALKSVNINIVFEPEWTKDMMSEEAKLELGLL
jgi:FeS assembly SUF system protein